MSKLIMIAAAACMSLITAIPARGATQEPERRDATMQQRPVQPLAAGQRMPAGVHTPLGAPSRAVRLRTPSMGPSAQKVAADRARKVAVR